MPKRLNDLIEAAKRVRMTAEDREKQRRSFAYGNTKIENDLITRKTIDRQADALKDQDDR